MSKPRTFTAPVDGLYSNTDGDWELVEGPLGVTIPPRTAAVKTCTTHHACACHERLAQIGRNYLENIEFQP